MTSRASEQTRQSRIRLHGCSGLTPINCGNHEQFRVHRNWHPKRLAAFQGEQLSSCPPSHVRIAQVSRVAINYLSVGNLVERRAPSCRQRRGSTGVTRSSAVFSPLSSFPPPSIPPPHPPAVGPDRRPHDGASCSYTDCILSL